MLMKRQQRMEEAAMLWKQLVDIGTYVGIAPYIELAKYYEHKVKDYVTARHFVNEAMKVMDKKSFLLKEGSGIFIQELTALRHRLGRLMRKLSSVEDSVRDESGQ
jgi:galactokinase